jgi:hypothetical protein
MQAHLQKFLSVLRIELEDLEEDINDLVRLYEARKSSHEITDYVYLENKSLLLNELGCLKDLVGRLAKIDTGAYATVEEMIAHLERTISDRARQCAFPEVVSRVVRRKIEKVKRYVLTAE